mgnify:CR=1 FL=1
MGLEASFFFYVSSLIFSFFFFFLFSVFSRWFFFFPLPGFLTIFLLFGWWAVQGLFLEAFSLVVWVAVSWGGCRYLITYCWESERGRVGERCRFWGCPEY